MKVKNWKVGEYIWTASAAGWFVLGVVVESLPALLTSLGCLTLAFIFNTFAAWEAEE